MSVHAGGEEPLPRLLSGSDAPGWWGMLGLIVIEAVVFTSLITGYFYLGTGQAWPPEGIHPPELLLPTLNTGVLVASAVPIWLGERAIRRGEQRPLRIGKIVGVALLVVFLALKYVEYSHKEYDWSTHAYGSVVWTMTGLHTLHVVGLILKSAAIGVLAWRGHFDERRHLAVQTNAMYWYFVVAVWIPLYATMYLAPRLH